jgi:hypothetical protein
MYLTVSRLYLSVRGQHLIGINRDVGHQYFRSDMTPTSPLNTVAALTSHSVDRENNNILTSHDVIHPANLIGDVMICCPQME